MSKNQIMTKRLTTDAVMVAVYVILSLLAITLGGLKITFEHLPVILCAVMYGPLDAMAVGGLGELFNQLTSFGLTPTTGLWLLPILIRGLMMGLCAKLSKKQMGLDAILKKNIPVVFWIVCAITGFISSCLNTLALYVDSKMFGYYNYVMVFGSLAVRILLGVLTSIVIAMCIKPVLNALKKAQLI